MAAAGSSKSVLVVEDDDDIREALHGLLADEGYEVNACSNGLEALERLRAGQRADVILLDLMMPVMDGWQFRIQQKRDPRFAAIPVLAISADTTPKAAAIDADIYLRKPVDSAALIEALERTLLSIERRKLQATLIETERLTSLGTLAAGMAHEINNPLAYVMANLEYVTQALQKAAPERDMQQVREALTETRDGCERIRAIVRDLQLFSRTREDDARPVDVRRVLDSSANIVMSQIRPRARLIREYGEVPPIVASEARLGQVFLNLVLNAAQAIPEGRAPENEIRLVTRHRAGAVVIEVHDTGEGIAQDLLGRIFDPFFTTKPIGVGTGLGLSISHRIVTTMGGELTMESTLGKGSVFRVRLPVSSQPTRAPSAPPSGAVTPARARLLVIDDDELLGSTLARVLDRVHDVTVLRDPDEAIARLARGERFDLVLCDLMMPERSGMEVHAALVSMAPDQAERMLFLTGGSVTESARDFLARHAVVEKPFSVEALIGRVNGALAAFERRKRRIEPPVPPRVQ